jgi:hypothetical protein
MIRLFIQFSKDISLLDCVESKYSCRDDSCNLSLRILRSVTSPLYVLNFNNLFPVVISLTFRGITLYRILTQEPAESVALAWVPLGIPLVVNAAVTGLIVFKILKVFRQIKGSSSLSTTHGHKIWSVVFIMIESGMAICSFQLARVVLGPLTTVAAGDAANLIGGITRMITVSIRLIVY